MKEDKSLWVRISLRAAAVSLIMAVFTRIWSYYQQISPARLDALFGVTAGAFLRLTDTFLLLAIALGVYQLLISKQDGE